MADFLHAITDPSARGVTLTGEQLNNADFRAQISSMALAVFVKLADAWKLSGAERLDLLGGVSRQTYHNWMSERTTPRLSRDQIERISLALGIEKGLKTLFLETERGQAWLRAANDDPILGQKAPLDLMRSNGMEGMRIVRRYLDSWRGMK